MVWMRLAAASVALSVAGAAQAASDAAQRFGAREDIEQISLSPDGKLVAFIEPVGARGSVVMVASTDTGTIKPVLRSTGDPDKVGSCRWATASRLICSAYASVDSGEGRLGFSRVFALDATGENMKMLSARNSDRALGVAQSGGEVIDWQSEKGDGSVLMTRVFVPEATTGTNLADTREGYGVEAIDTVTLKRSIVEQPRLGAVEYITDGHGVVRVMGIRGTDSSGYAKNTLHYLYRMKGSRTWKPLSDVVDQGSSLAGFDPYAVDSDRDVVYGFDANGDHTALFAISLDGSLKKELVLARADVDVDGLVRIGRQKRVVGASFVTDRREIDYFDPELKKLAASLSKALPGLPLVSIVDASADESKLLLFAGSDVDPGRYYLFDKATRQLAEVLPARPQLAKTKLAAVKSITYPAADGTQIPAYLTLPPGSDGKKMPAIVMPHGGPEARDSWGFDWLAQFFANRGFAVIQPNFRGSTGYGITFLNKNGFQSWATAIGDVNDAGRWMVAQGIADPAKLAIVGWSYGGYAALQSAVVDPQLFKAVVAVAPVTDFDAWRNEFKDFVNFPNVDARVGHGPYIEEGSPARHADRFVAPVLLFHGDRDDNVGIGESRLMASRLKAAGKTVDLVEFHGLDHQLDDGEARAAMLDRMDGFLRSTLSLQPAP